MNDVVQNLMREATRLTQSGQLQEATAAIQRALGRAPHAAEGLGTTSAPGTGAAPPPTPEVLEGLVFELDARTDTTPPTAFNDAPTGAGSFSGGSHSEASLTRRYKLTHRPPLQAAACPWW